MFKHIVLTGLVVLTATVANADTVQTAKTADLKLANDATLRGQLTTTSGQSAGNLEVVLKNNQGTVIQRAMAGEDGLFAIGPVQPGAYQLQVGSEVIQVRVWSPEVAPPTAGTALLFPVGSSTVRGQLLGGLLGGGGVGVGVAVVGATVATVVAVSVSQSSGS